MNGSKLMAVLVAIAAAVATGCGSTGGTGEPARDPAGSRPAGSPVSAPASAPAHPAAQRDVVFLVGHQSATGAAAGRLPTFETRLNATPGPGDVVLFTVSVLDGPMPQTREQIEALRGKPYGPAAILLVKTDEQDDPELRELVVIETRDLLAANRHPRASELSVINAEDPNVELLLRGLAASG